MLDEPPAGDAVPGLLLVPPRVSGLALERPPVPLEEPPVSVASMTVVELDEQPIAIAMDEIRTHPPEILDIRHPN